MSFSTSIGTLSVEEKVGQLFQIGFPGPRITGELAELVSDYHVGGILYFRDNIESLDAAAALSEQLRELASDQVAPPLISVDEEGGAVSRLRGAVHLPSQMAIGATGEPAYAREAGTVAGRQLASAGVTVNLAPVLDVNSDPENPVIGTRAYGDDPESVAAFGEAYIEGLQSQGVSACAKHFPGHGDTAVDSHFDLPVIPHGRDRLDAVELVPFRRAIDGGVDSVMTAHVSFPSVDPEPGRPATLSQEVLTGLLREDLGFDGVIVTDCMEMSAITDYSGTVEGAVQSLAAGADSVVVSHTPEKQRAAIEAVVEAVESGRLSEARIDDSVARILALKSRAGDDGTTFDPDEVAAVADRIAGAAVTVVRDEPGTLPIEARLVTVVAFDGADASPVADAVGDYGAHPLVGRLRSHGVDVKFVRSSPPIDASALETTGPVIVLSDDAANDPDQQASIEGFAESTGDLVVLAVRNPYDVRVLPAARTFVTCYDRSPACLRASADVLIGARPARGRCPVRRLSAEGP